MSTRYNTGNPIESTDVRDMSDNAKNLDLFLNSTSETLVDRLGETRLTVEGAVEKTGFKPGAGDFVTGFTVMPGMRNIAWKNTNPPGDGNWYSWGGAIPSSGKIVPPNSTPETTGGFVNGWRPRSDSMLSSSSGASLVGVRTSEENLEALLYADDMAIKYGFATKSAKERINKHGAKIVLIGDSLSSFFNIDSVNISSIYESYLRRKVMELNPSAKFYNRAIGGMRYYDLGKDAPALTSLSTSYPWYDNTSRRWMSYIDDLKPDVVVLAFGMNDGPGWDVGNFQQPIFHKMMDELKTISSSPEIVFSTNILPSTINPATGTEDQQLGRDAIAGWTRSYARKAGYSCIDLHRRFKCLRDGVDPCMSSFARKTIRQTVTLPYSYPEKCNSYSARVTLIDPLIMSDGIGFQLSDYTNNIMVLQYDIPSGRWITTQYTGSNSTVGIANKSIAQGPSPVADTEIYFTMNGDVVTVMVGINTTPVFSGSVVRFGGDFTPVIGGSGSVKIDLIRGDFIKVKSELTDEDIYSVGVDGGNGLNHPTAKASSKIYTRPLDDWFESLNESEKTSSVDIDFVSGRVVASNNFSPELCGETKLSQALTFINGSLSFSRDTEGRVIGAIFGGTNRAYIDSSLFNSYSGSFTSMSVEVDFFASASNSYPITLGEGVAGDRFIFQVTPDIRPRATLSVPSGSSDLIGSASFPYLTGTKYSARHDVECSISTSKLSSPDGAGRGNITVNTITSIPSTTFSKIKFGYVSGSTFGADVVVSRVRLNFSS